MNKDNYGEIINGIDTYETIAKELKSGKSIIIGWTDEEADHRDILFTLRPTKSGNLQRGLNFSSQLYISIMSYFCIGFLIESDCDNRKADSYIREKLRLGENHCDLEICELINGVIHELDKMEGNIKYEKC